MKDMYEKNVEVAEILKALAHPLRLCIVKGLLEKGESTVTNMQDCMNSPQSTISQQLQKLKSVGIIKGNRKGLEIHYYICDERIKDLIKLFF